MDNFLNKEGARKIFRFLMLVISKKLDKSAGLTGITFNTSNGTLVLHKNGAGTSIISAHLLLTAGSRRSSGTYIAKEALKNSLICLQCSETEVVPVSNNYSTSTTKTLTTLEFDPYGAIFYYYATTSANVSQGSTINADNLFEYYTFDIRYTFNISTLTVNKDVFIKCSPLTDGKVKLATGLPIVQDLPTTEDTFVYILLGHASSTTLVLLTLNHPIYYYKDGAIRQWTNAKEGISATTLSGYGITDAKIENGTITLGSNTITPLTTHLSLTNYVTLNGNQTITGEKTFSGDKRVKFKQSAAANKLGFTLFDTANNEVGNFEWQPSGVNSKPTIALGLWRLSTATALGYVAIKMNDIPGSAYYALVTPFPADAKTPLGLSDTAKVLYFPLQFKNGSSTVLTASTGVVDLSTLVSNYLTQTTFDTNNADLAAIEALASTSGVLVKTAANTWTLSNTVGATPIINHGTSDTTFALTPNILHNWGEVSNLTLTLATPSDATIVNEYLFKFTSPSTATTLSLPATVSWVTEPLIEPSKTYWISIVDNLATWLTDNMTVEVGDINYVSRFATKTYVDTELALKEDISNKVTSVDENSTDTQYPSAKAMYDALNP